VSGSHGPARPPIQYFLVLVVVNLMWAFQFSGAKIATERLGPVTVTFIPLALSTVLFAPLVRLSRGQKPKPRFTAAVFRGLLLAGTLGIIPSQLGLTWGVQHSLASNASVLTLTIPVLTAIMAVILLGERMTVVRWLSFALAICGVLMVSDIDWRSVEIFRGTYLLGNLLLFASCLGSAFYNTYSKKLLETFNPVELLVYTFLVAGIELLILMLILEPPKLGQLLSLGLGVWTTLLTIALFSLSVSATCCRSSDAKRRCPSSCGTPWPPARGALRTPKDSMPTHPRRPGAGRNDFSRSTTTSARWRSNTPSRPNRRNKLPSGVDSVVLKAYAQSTFVLVPSDKSGCCAAATVPHRGSGRRPSGTSIAPERHARHREARLNQCNA
jgi:drug/metabolite transporter (DMT)-like permease